MSEINLYKTLSEGEIQQKLFKQIHGVDLPGAQYARAIVERDLMIINHFYENGEIDFDRLNEIADDLGIQNNYMNMLEMLIGGDKKGFKRKYDVIYKEIDLFCGWLDFFDQHLSNMTGLNLIPSPEDDPYEEFLDHNNYSPI